jgi:SET domain-containing protein
MRSKIKIKTSRKYGRGLYAKRKIPKNTVVEISPVIIVKDKDRRRLSKTKLADYIFDWGTLQPKRKASVVLGLGSIFNHSNKPNVTYDYDFKGKCMVFKTTKKVPKGKQLFIDYGYIPRLDIDILRYKNKRQNI